MSMKPDFGNPPDYWTYMSEVMLRILSGFISAKIIVSESIPKGIFADSNKFFDLAVNGEDYGRVHPDNRAAHFKLFQFLCSLQDFKDFTDEDICGEIKKLSDFNASLSTAREMNEEDLKYASILIKLYKVLINEGYEDRSNSRGPGCY